MINTKLYSIEEEFSGLLYNTNFESSSSVTII